MLLGAVIGMGSAIIMYMALYGNKRAITDKGLIRLITERRKN